ncbi:RagB/SusD family nutrient uptake outer membrane protein [Ohtaekwangia koreensis]|uniref:SusD family protein n=1 Tax=Ohtaekwangia koreensis TaxID=688867 RepID=A0A1T5MHD1_9BACT|nr:RagB/SusD family nutrient uptake outer membrane protein [Ohtaekwangia koreensis]SKC87651.1 SusD family protein [Ohtaekwangia koreensis]
MKKYIIFLVAILTLLAPFGCSDYLDVDPEGVKPTEEFFQTQEDAVSAVNAIYARMRTWQMVAFAYVIMQEITSDNSIKGSSQGDASFINDFDKFTFTSNQGTITDYWNGRYEGINLSNQVLSNVPDIEMNETLKTRLLGEAKFTRALFYFDLVRAFGDVPMPTSIDNVLEASTVRTPKDEVYAQIIQDLTDAIAVLPDSYDAANVGRATNGAARGLLAKVYLYRGEWDKVLEQTSAIINSNRYGLEENFYDVFRIPFENGKESLFEIQASAVAGNADLSNSQHSQVQGVRGTNGFGWGFNIPSDDLAAAFDAAGDEVRKKVTILYKGDVTEDGDVIEGVGNGELEGVNIPRYNGKSYVPRNRQVSGVNEGAEQNIRVLRYAEILLIDAEAKVQKGDIGGAATSLNLVRERVDLDPIEAPTLQDIWNERRLELAMEGDRFFDLVRTGQAATVLGPQGFVSGKNDVFPVPQVMIDITNNAIPQNNGY